MNKYYLSIAGYDLEVIYEYEPEERPFRSHVNIIDVKKVKDGRSVLTALPRFEGEEYNYYYTLLAERIKDDVEDYKIDYEIFKEE